MKLSAGFMDALFQPLPLPVMPIALLVFILAVAALALNILAKGGGSF
jgi:hypothetical protein